MKCINCGHMVNSKGQCTYCGTYHHYIDKAINTADYYYNMGLEKANLRDMYGAIEVLEKALTYNKMHIDARNLLGLVYYEVGEIGKAYRAWKISVMLFADDANLAWHFLLELKQDPGLFSEANEAAKKYNLALTYARQGSEDLALIQLKKAISRNPKYVPAYLLFALLYMKDGDMNEAKKNIDKVLAIDPYNTTAQLYQAEILGAMPAQPGKPAAKVIQKEESRIRSIDYYEDPDKEKWKQFVYLLIGLGIGIVAMIVLVIPSVRSGVSTDYRALQKEYKKTVEAKDSEIEELKSDKASFKKQNEKLKKQLTVYEGTDGEDSMYDSLLKASQSYAAGDYAACADSLAKVKKDSLPSKTAKDLYTSMKDSSYSNAADQLYEEGKELYYAYDYQKALEKFKKSYSYRKNYSTLYYLAMCYKNNGDMKTATKYFYEIINDSGDYNLVQQAANYGLEMTIDEGRIAAGQDPKDVYGESGGGYDEDYDEDYDENYDEDYDSDYDENYDEDYN